MTRERFTAVAFFMAGALAAIILTFSANLIPIGYSQEYEPPPLDEKAIELAENLSRAFEQVAARVSPAVVHIATTKTVTRQPMFEDEFFERFFRSRPMPREYRHTALGSGIIISSDGYILTNNHVVSEADELKVKLSDQREFDAKVVGADPESEVAVIKIDGKNLPTAALGDSDTIRVGQWVIAIGNPFGFDRTVTTGIVSAKGRMLGMQAYEDFIQTDAAINPGNSGGPLVNLRGEVVGINTVIVSRTGGYQGLGFAIPINMASAIKDSLIQEGRVVRGFLGVQLQEIEEDVAKALGLDGREGSLVASVIEGSAAEEAGIQNGDIIVEFDGKKITGADRLRHIVAETPVGKEVEVIVNRQGEQIKLTAKIGDRSESIAAGAATVERAADKLGMVVEEITPQIQRELGLKASNGVVVTRVAPDGIAAKKGISPGTIILEIRQQPVRNTADYRKLMAEADLDKGVLVLIQQNGVNKYVVLKSE